MKKKYRVWTCKIVVDISEDLPEGFDGPPRLAAMDAIEDKGINVLGCFSGWGGKLTETEQYIIEMSKE